MRVERSTFRIIQPTMAVAVVVALCIALLGAGSLFAAPPAQAQNDFNTRITPTSVGPAVLGSTLDQLEAQLGADYDISDLQPVTVDFTGYVIRRDGDIQFRAVVDDETDLITTFLISNGSYVTVEGAMPGMSVLDAIEIFGDASFAWFPEQESREFVFFANQTDSRFLFRTPGVGGNNVGIYEDGEFETTDFDEEGVISSIWITCEPGVDCPEGADVSSQATDDDSTDDDTTDDDTADPTDSDVADDDADDDTVAVDPATTSLPNTGSQAQWQLVTVSTLVILGGALVVGSRRFDLGPTWLGSDSV